MTQIKYHFTLEQKILHPFVSAFEDASTLMSDVPHKKGNKRGVCFGSETNFEVGKQIGTHKMARQTTCFRNCPLMEDFFFATAFWARLGHAPIISVPV